MLKKFYIYYKIYICFFMIYLALYLKRNHNNNKKLFRVNEKANLSHYEKSIIKYPKLNEIKLNYYGKCGEIFKYKENNKRDLVFFSYKFTKYYFRRSFFIYNIIDSFKKNIPNAKIVCFVQDDSSNSLVVKLLKKNNVLIIKEKILNMEIANSRFLYEYEYLKKNINFFDRIIHADLTDIFFFSDVFKTLKPNELIINKECGKYSVFGKNGNYILKHPVVLKWFKRTFGENKIIVKEFKRINPMLINSGLIMGDSKEYLKFLKVMKDNFNHKKASIFGYEQMLINVLYYTGHLNKVNMKFDLCTQRSCFRPILIFDEINKNLYFKNGCSPVVIHKSYPRKSSKFHKTRNL